MDLITFSITTPGPNVDRDDWPETFTVVCEYSTEYMPEVEVLSSDGRNIAREGSLIATKNGLSFSYASPPKDSFPWTINIRCVVRRNQSITTTEDIDLAKNNPNRPSRRPKPVRTWKSIWSKRKSLPWA